jgi:calcineurin-like phosphoesterase family protein
MIFFTSDEHFNHPEIIQYCCQPFKTLEEKQNLIIQNHNDLVNEDDVVYHLGDFSYRLASKEEIKNVLRKYKKVSKRILILGNHDLEFDYQSLSMYEGVFDEIYEVYVFKYKDLTFCLCHDPCYYQESQYDKICVCGHVHSLFRTLPNRAVFNCGVDVNNYYPVHIEEVLNSLKWSRVL